MSSGLNANLSGKELENSVEKLLESSGFIVLKNKEFEHFKNKGLLPKRYVVKDVPYKNIYGEMGKTEFVIHSDELEENALFSSTKKGFDCRIECKRQSVKGSVDEKFPNLLLNAEQAYPEKNVIIIAELPGARNGAVNWLEEAVKNRIFKNDEKKVLIKQDFVQFSHWVGDTFKK